MPNDLLEIVGDDYDDLEYDDEAELQGYDDFEIGAKRAAPKVRRRAYSRARRQMLPFGSTGSLAALASIDLLGNPQVPFKPERLIIQEITTTNAVILQDVKVGKNSQFVSAGDFPSTLFAGDANEGLFQFDTARPGIDIVVSILNADGVSPLTAYVGMVGVTLNR
jgi:hypothetical protein